MKSIQNKYLILILSCILVTSITVLGIGEIVVHSVIKNDSEVILKLQCEEKSLEIDHVLRGISQSVDQIASYAQEEMQNSQDFWTSETRLDDYMQRVRDVAVGVAENTDSAVSVYFRFNEELEIPTAGMFMTRETPDGTFTDHELTDISKYAKDDLEHVGWYYIPMETGKAVWMDPYVNRNIGVYMISYIVPIIEGDQIIALVGMDIGVELLYQAVAQVKVYDTGYAFLWGENGDLLYHKNYPEGMDASEFSEEVMELKELSDEALESDTQMYYQWEGVPKWLKSAKLVNGMVFVICVPERELYTPLRRLIVTAALFLILFLLIAVWVTIQMTRLMIRPLQQLSVAAKQIADGDLDVRIECNSKDEIRVLAESFDMLAKNLKKHIEYISKLAYTDILTGAGNKTAYEERIKDLDEQIKDHKAAFAVVVMDINNLKMMNDTYGHEMGDRLIMDAASIMSDVFKPSELFRIGGDEFVAILAEDVSFAFQKFLDEFQKAITSFNIVERQYEMELHVAGGGAAYDNETDCAFADVFRRADEKMYEDKALQKRTISPEL